MAVTTHYQGTSEQLAEHLRELAAQAQANVDASATQHNKRYHAGRRDGLNTAAGIAANFTFTPEEH